MLLLLSRFSHVRLCATPLMEAHQAPPSLGFSRQEQWSGLPFPSPMDEMKSEREVTQSCPTLSDPMDYSLPGSSIHGIFQARVLEWGAIAFSIYIYIYIYVYIYADGDCNHEIKNHLLFGRKTMTKLDSILKSRDITLLTKVHLVKLSFFQ